MKAKPAATKPAAAAAAAAPSAEKSLATGFIMTMGDDDDDVGGGLMGMDAETLQLLQRARSQHDDDDDDEVDADENGNADDDEDSADQGRAKPKSKKKAQQQQQQHKKKKASAEDSDINPNLEFDADGESKLISTWDLARAKRSVFDDPAQRPHGLSGAAAAVPDVTAKSLDELIQLTRQARRDGTAKPVLPKKAKSSAMKVDDDDDDEDGNNNDDDDDDDDEDEDEEDGDSLDGDVMADGSDDEGEANGYDDEQDDDDEEELDEKALAAANNPKLYSDSEDDDDEADEVARPPAKGKKPARKQQSSDDEEDEDSEDSDDSEDDDDDDDDDDSPKDKARAARERERKEKLKAAFFEQAPADIISSKQFTEMNLSRPLLRAISSLNFANATDIQAATIPPALMGRDLVACAKTGSGKTAAFLLPVLERLLYRQKTNPASRVLVLSPTRELAVQCHAMGEKLAKFTDIRMSLICGGFSTKRQQAELRAHPDVIVATPGRLIDHLQNSPGFDLEGIEVLIMDEADRLLEMGFKEEVDEIIRQCSVSRQTMLFSATMTDEVENLIALSMNKPLRVFINKNTDTATNLTQEFVRVRPQREKEKEAIVLAVCKRSFHTKTIVFFRSKQGAHRAKVIFGLFGLKAAELHGDLNQLQRLESLEAFKEGRVDFLLATDLASRGLDIVGVETVVNADMPNTLTQYIHRVGRTARAGRAGRSLSLVCEGERKLLKEIVKHATVPLSSRSIPSDVIEKFSTKIRGASKDIAAIMKAEKEEKMLLQAEMEAAKASNMMEHEKEIYSKPARTWFQDALAKKTSKENSKVAHAGGAAADKGKTQQARPSKRKSEEDLQDQRVQKAMGRSVKKARLGLRPGDAPPPNPNKSPKQAKKSGGAVGFTRELTDVSKKSVHGLRTSTNQRDGGKKGGKGGAGASGDRKRGNPKVTNKSFKSKAKFKRR